MHVPMVENWVDVKGTLKAIQPSNLADHVGLVVEVDDQRNVEQYPNLLDKAAGSTISIGAAKDAVERAGLKPGDQLSLRVRRGGLDSYFAHPDLMRRL